MCLLRKFVNIITNPAPTHFQQIFGFDTAQAYRNHDANDSLMGGLVTYFAPEVPD